MSDGAVEIVTGSNKPVVAIERSAVVVVTMLSGDVVLTMDMSTVVVLFVSKGVVVTIDWSAVVVVAMISGLVVVTMDMSAVVVFVDIVEVIHDTVHI